MICWVTKLRIKSIAAKDAKGLYGKSLIQRQMVLNENSSNKIEFQPSDFMKSLVNDYTNSAQKFLNKRKNIVALYAQIKQCYARFNEANDELNNKKSAILSTISDIDTEIANTKTEIMEISQLLSDFYEGKSLPSGLTSHKLITSKTNLEQKCVQKQAEKESASDLSSIQTEYDKLAKELRNKVILLETDFSKQIDLLYERICKIEIKYNEQIGYYWQELCKYIQNKRLTVKNNQIIQISEFIKQLKDIVSSCGISLISKEDLFKSECTFINTTINEAMGIQYKV